MCFGILHRCLLNYMGQLDVTASNSLEQPRCLLNCMGQLRSNCVIDAMKYHNFDGTELSIIFGEPTSFFIMQMRRGNELTS